MIHEEFCSSIYCMFTYYMNVIISHITFSRVRNVPPTVPRRFDLII